MVMFAGANPGMLERGKKTLILSSSLDNRFGEGYVASRVNLKEPAIMFGQGENIFDIVENNAKKNDVHCVLVDECQFLKKEQVNQLSDVVDTLNIPVICYGLRSDYRGEPFEGSCWLLALADSIEEIKTICHCGKKAIMNLRVVGGKAIFQGEQVIIGGNESYVSVCRKHFKEGNLGGEL